MLKYFTGLRASITKLKRFPVKVPKKYLLILLLHYAVNTFCNANYSFYQQRVEIRLVSYIHYLGKDIDSIAAIPPFQITKREEEGDEGECWNIFECRHKGKIR